MVSIISLKYRPPASFKKVLCQRVVVNGQRIEKQKDNKVLKWRRISCGAVDESVFICKIVFVVLMGTPDSNGFVGILTGSM